MLSWAEQTIWWHLYPLGFTGAEPSALPPGTPPVSRLRGLEPWLDHLLDLGCNGLALGPVFASETHGYDTVDYFRLDPRLGTDQDLLRLIETCHDRGIRVLLDGVFHHVGRGFEPFQNVRTRGRDSAFTNWFRLTWDPSAPDGFTYADFEGHQGLVALNHDSPQVAEYVADVLTHWLARGVDGWRLDAAYAVPDEFWATVLPRVRDKHPEAWFFGEVIHGDYSGIVGRGHLDSVTQYELWKAIWSSINDHNFYELAWALDRHQEFARAFVPQTFLGNHDVTRIASRLGGERHLGHALAVLLTVPGIPSIYAGDEQGYRGVKEDRAGGDDAVRPAFPAAPSDLPAVGEPVYRLHQELIGLRRRHPWLVRGNVEVLLLENQRLAYRVTGPSPGDRLQVLLNLTGEPFHHDHLVAGPAGWAVGWAIG